MEATITLGKAVEIFETSDFNNIQESDWNTIRRRAKRRWHPDKISHTNPEPETFKRFQENFALIEDAIEFVKSHINGDIHTGERVTSQFRDAVQEEPEDIIRRNAPEMQEALKSIWEKVKQQGYKVKEEVSIIYPGSSYSDLLKQDLKDNIPIFSISSFFFGIFLYAFSVLITTLVLSSAPSFQKFTLLILSGAWLIQALACFIGLLPLSRFWLPQKIGDGVIYLINVGMKFFDLVVQFGLTRNTFIDFLFGIPVLLARVVQGIIVTPIYLIASMMIGDRMFGKVEEKGDFYAGLAGWFIEDLIHGDVNNFSSDQLFALSHAYAELKEIS